MDELAQLEQKERTLQQVQRMEPYIVGLGIGSAIVTVLGFFLLILSIPAGITAIALGMCGLIATLIVNARSLRQLRGIISPRYSHLLRQRLL